jgi:hypothetical protein
VGVKRKNQGWGFHVGSLYGIESEDSCRIAIDQLLALVEQARRLMNKESVAALNDQLADYYKKGSSMKSQERMSRIEQSNFWAAIHAAYVRRPSLNERSKWNTALYDVEGDLQFYRPKESKA